MGENEIGMEGVELEQEDEEFVEEPMTADFDYANANDPIALDEPISQGTGTYYILLIKSAMQICKKQYQHLGFGCSE
jgi:hypothetical protein